MLQENYLPEGTKTTMMDDAMKRGNNEITLADNEYFCMGDNRPVSNDSRNLGPFTVNRIKAVGVIRVFPLNEMKLL
jgi:signal peptidase I